MTQDAEDRHLLRLTYTVDEAAELLGIGRGSAYQAAKRGEIRTLRIGKRLLVPRAWLDEQLCERRASRDGTA